MCILRACFLNSYIKYSHIAILNQQSFPEPRHSIKIPEFIRNPQKQREYIYSRSLLFHLAPNLEKQGIFLQANKKPVANEHKPYFSISHSTDWIAVIINYVNMVSVDIQLNSETRLNNIATHFLSEQEINKSEPNQLTARWSIKECIYKYFFPQYRIPFKLININLPKILKSEILHQPLLSLQAPYQNLTLPRVYLYTNSQWALSFIA